MQPHCGAITFVQRFGSALQLNLHFHVLVPDGAFDHDGVFVADDAPDDHDVRELLVRAGRKVIAMLRRFLDEDGDDDSRRREIDRLLASLDAASATPLPSLFRCMPPRGYWPATDEAFAQQRPRADAR